MTSHSLEPLRPWKAEQLGGGYALSLFCERTALEAADAVIAVSGAMRDDVLHTYPAVEPERVTVIPNGIDPDEYKPDLGTGALERLGVDVKRPIVMFLGRVTRQKGVDHLLDASAFIDPTAQMLFCAGAADTPGLGQEMRSRAAALDASRGGILWVEEMLPRHEVVQLLSHASVFVCPSTYEPFGLINLEAMACQTAVVATATGGIPEVVLDGETGWLVPLTVNPGGRPVDAEGFARDLAARVNELLADPETARRFGRAGRQRVVEHFGWPAVAAKTAALYSRVAGGGAGWAGAASGP
jgi:starch synthase